MSHKESECPIKVILVGDPCVGKTSIILRFVDNTFITDNVTTHGVNVKTRAVSFGKKSVKIILTDTVGQERFRTISRSIYRDADAIILVYDQASEASFQSMKVWYNEVAKYSKEKATKALVANKSDLNPVVQRVTGKAFAEELGMHFFEVSAKLDVSLDSLFQHIVQSAGESIYKGEDWSKFKISKSGGSRAGASSSRTTHAAPPQELMSPVTVGSAPQSPPPKRRFVFCIIL